MIIIIIPIKKELIIELLDNKTIQDTTFTLIKQDNIKLYFKVNKDEQKAIKIAKDIIQNSPLGKVLFYHITYEK